MQLDEVSFRGWEKCLRILSDHAELIITTQVGPRILSYRTLGGENVLWVDESEAGGSGEPEFKVRGGHRLWVSPEDERSYAPDNVPVNVRPQGSLSVRLENAATSPWQIRKLLTVTLSASDSGAIVDHLLTNMGEAPITVATWGLTVMAPGGFEIIPQPPYRPHGVGSFLPERVVVPWSFTDFSDPRWKFGSKYWLLTPQSEMPATKMGFLNREGWLAWTRRDALFIKRFEHKADATYPDFGCNCETFTKGDFLELESLGPLRTLEPGQSWGHTEFWRLITGLTPPAALDDTTLEKWLAPHFA